MKEESHRASEVCEKSVDKTTHRTKPRRLDGHSLYSAQRPPGPRDFQADHREVRPAARQFRWRRHSPQGDRRSAGVDLALGQCHPRSSPGRQGGASAARSAPPARLRAGLWLRRLQRRRAVLYRLGTALADTVLMFHRERLGEDVRLITIDLDATDDPTHGQQEFALFNGYYDTWCYLPLIATVTFNTEPLQHVIAALLRPGTGAATRGVRGLLRRLFIKLRTLFPRARLRVRADAGFAAAKLLAFLDGAEVEYVLGLAGNRRLDKRVRRLLGRARMQARTTGDTATLYGETRYAARRWDRKRRIIMKAEVLCYPGRSRKDNPRFLVTNLPHRPATVYTRLYCGRGDMENRLKELQHGVAMDRTSCSRFAANQLRLLFSVAAYALFQTLQTFACLTGLGAAQVGTLRERLVKVAVWVERSVRRIVLHLPQAFPWRETWGALAHALTAT